MPDYTVHLPRPHAKQEAFIHSGKKRVICRSGRRSGKTVGIGIFGVERFLAGKRVLYAAPTAEQCDRFWTTVTRALDEPVRAGVFRKNETERLIELVGTEQRIRAKTAYNADTLRGDYADELILDEWQLMDEDAWELVGAPMLLDNNGDAVFIYTPPSLHSRSRSKAKDPQHAAKMFKKALADKSGRWAAFSFTSHDNPYLSREALSEITNDMTALAVRMEIMAEDVDEAPGALWTRANLEANRITPAELPALARIVVAVDPSTSTTGSGDEAGIIGAGLGMVGRVKHFYCLRDGSLHGSPLAWASAAVRMYHELQADCIVAEANQGGEMVRLTIRTVDPNVRVKLVHASRGKATRAEPIAAAYEQGQGHHVGSFPALEDELCLWLPGDASPNRLDAMVWAASELLERGELKKATAYQG